MSVINQKDYLKKYLKIGKQSKEKKKRKKTGEKSISKGMKIIDDDIDVSLTQEIQDDIDAANEDAPQIVAIVDERPPSLRIDEKTQRKLWKPFGDETTVISTANNQRFQMGSIKINTSKDSVNNSSQSSSGSSLMRNAKGYSPPSKQKVNDDYSPPRRNKSNDISPIRKKIKNNNSPPRQRLDIDSSPPRAKIDKYGSPPRKRIGKDSSPPRKRTGKDSSPPRKRIDEDISPPRKRVGIDSSPPRKRIDKDNSPPRKRIDGDNSPPRKRIDGDISPPRKRKNIDNSPPRRRPNTSFKREKSIDNSPPRKERDNDNSPPRIRKTIDNSPPRRRTDTDESPPSRKKHNNSLPSSKSSSPTRSKKSRWGDQETNQKPETTLSGKKSGLQRAQNLVEDMIRVQREEEEMFKSMSTEISGANAATIVRTKKQDIPDPEKIHREQELKEKYLQWGKGLKQVEDAQEKLANERREMEKPLARYADDEDLEKYLKEQEREGDPMLAYIRKKKKKVAIEKGVLEKPMYMGDFMPNRFGIRPGYRWDGVDRSSGYESKWFQVQNSKRAMQEEALLWSQEDM